MALNTLLIDLEPKIGKILRASDPENISAAVARIKQQLQSRNTQIYRFRSSL